MRILCVEDETSVHSIVRTALHRDGHDVHVRTTAESGTQAAAAGYYDLMLLDLGLPDGHGIDVITALRQAYVSVPIIVLTGAGDTSTKAHALFRGADDFITKPFDLRELRARIDAVTRRERKQQDSAQATSDFGRVKVDFTQRAVLVDEKDIRLTNREFDIFKLLAKTAGRPVGKNKIALELYGGSNDEPGRKIIDVFACKMRAKFVDHGVHRDAIRTIWSEGYLFDPDATRPDYTPKPSNTTRTRKRRGAHH